MDKLEHYRSCIQTLLEKHSQYKSREENVESEIFFDTVRDHYQLMRVGWKGLKRVYYTVLHFDIKDGKIWLQQNTTDIDVGQELLEMGIPKQDIVLGLHPPKNVLIQGMALLKRKFPRVAGELPPETITRWEFPAFGKLCYMTTFVETLMWRWFQLFLA
jgi:hypothetical protein